MINVGIIGISGYSGQEALKLLLNHPKIRVTYVSAYSSTGTIDELCPELKGRTKLVCGKFDIKEALPKADLFFLAVPHKVSMSITPDLLAAGKRVIDLSADYRLKKASVFNQWYDVKHTDSKNLKKAVYGLPEFYRADIKNAKLIANPGCYPTAAILGLGPIVSMYGKDIDNITIDAKSGVSGAGRKAAISLNYCEVNENFKAYKALHHQHTPEIEQYISQLAEQELSISFVPHLLPINRGILETIYVRFKNNVSLTKMHSLYKKFYKTEKFVRVLDKGIQPEIKNVVRTNYCDIGLETGNDKKLLLITSVIDNLSKGAASQAVQNMNIMCDFKETEGLL